MKIVTMLTLLLFASSVTAQEPNHIINIAVQEWGRSRTFEAAQNEAIRKAEEVCESEIKIEDLTISEGRCVEGRCSAYATIAFYCLTN